MVTGCFVTGDPGVDRRRFAFGEIRRGLAAVGAAFVTIVTDIEHARVVRYS
jgi:hypothetical protein